MTSRSTPQSPWRSRQTSNGRETVRSDAPASQAAFVFAPPMSTASVAAAVAGMRVVPVIDLKDGTAVHAVRGERERYRLVRSVIGGKDGDPLSLARAFRSELGLDELYVADLDALGGEGEDSSSISALAREARVMVDAGVSEPERAWALLALGAHRVVVGTETLTGPEALDRLLAELPERAVALSVDLRDGRALSPNPQLMGLPALGVVARLHRAALGEVIVLDLARVGSGAGPDIGPIAEIHAAFPDLQLLAGGGVRDVEDLRALGDAGAAGALVATALHGGVIGPRELAELR
jgi:phosphoribosylformimino-5-aminoimidazole carboxamide ribotide isomerase